MIDPKELEGNIADAAKALPSISAAKAKDVCYFLTTLLDQLVLLTGAEYASSLAKKLDEALRSNAPLRDALKGSLARMRLEALAREKWREGYQKHITRKMSDDEKQKTAHVMMRTVDLTVDMSDDEAPREPLKAPWI